MFQPAFDAIRQANRGTLSQACLQRSFDDVWHHPLDWVAQHHHFSTDMLAAAWKQFRVLQVVRPMHGYADLPILSELPLQRFLVTSGFRRLQESKIKALGIQDLFAAVFVDAIDEPKRIGKKGLFRLILEKYDLSPKDALVIGDSGTSEIEAGNQLSIDTVQILRPGVIHAPNAKFHVRSLTDLRLLLVEKETSSIRDA